MATRTRSIDDLASELHALLGEARVSRSGDVLHQHGTDESWHRPAPPDVVVFPETVDEVVGVVDAARATGTPIVPFGAGTSLEGHVAALSGGVCVDLTRMNRIVRVGVDDLDVTVEAGVTRKQLDARLRPEGIFFPVDPGADATIGGMVATGASGTTAVRYGTMRQNVLALTVVTAAGTVLRTGSRARKSSSGYDLTHLFVGSEGTLGIVVEATLRVYPTPEAISAAVCSFPSVDAAVACVMETIQLGVPVARIELLDEALMGAVVRRAELPYAVAPTLFLEFHGTPDGVVEQASTVGEIAAEHEGGSFAWATDQEERTRLWEARHDSYAASLSLRPGAKGFVTDVCVPISQLARCIGETRRDIDDAGLVGPMVGHVGDGNFHVTFMIDPDAAAELRLAEELTGRMVRRALELGGTCTGEHGVGYGKARYLPLEHGAEGVAAMRAIKSALDPDGLMNPGKILPPESERQAPA